MKSGSARFPQIIRKISVLPLAAVIFFTVSGGPYGLEPVISYAGSYAIPLLLIVPLLWDIPMILAVLELNSMMPLEGGYYEWVKRGLGLPLAFMEGWWTWLYSFVDLAIYPVLFVEYAAFFFPQIEMYKVPVFLAVIWGAAFLNIRGIVPVGKTAMVLTAIVLIPFFILFLTGYFHPVYTIHPHTGMNSLSLALFTIMWNCIGWDNATTYAGEVQRPVSSYLKAITIAFAGIYLFSLSFIYLAQHSPVSGSEFAEKGIPFLATKIGGNSLGAMLSLGGMASMLGIFCAVMLSVSRIPAVMSKDNLFPKIFTKLHPRFQTPYVSIILFSSIVSLLVLRPLSDLVIMDICLYTCGIALEFVALINLRKKAPEDIRPFRIPLKKKGLMILFIIPILVFIVALVDALSGSTENIHAAMFAILAILSAPAVWFVISKVKKTEG
jgi:amino acid transporter